MSSVLGAMRDDAGGDESGVAAVRVYGTTTTAAAVTGGVSEGDEAGSQPTPLTLHHHHHQHGTTTVTDSSALLDERVAHDDRYPLDNDWDSVSSYSDDPSHSLSESSHLRTSLPRFVEDSLDHVSWLRHPKVKEQWKVVLASFTLTVTGLALIVAGLVFIATHSNVSSYVFLITGFICFIPGVYHFLYIYLAATGRCGLSTYNMPVFK